MTKSGKALNFLFVIFSAFAFLICFVLDVKVKANSGLDDALRRVAERCPSMTIKGIKRSCGGLMQAGLNEEDILRNVIVGGLGYDRFNHEMKGQVLKSRSYTETQQNRFLTKVITDAQSLYNFFYPMDLSNNFYNGLYSRRLDSNQLFGNYFRGNMKVAVGQKQYLTHITSATGTFDLTEDFEDIIGFLPDTFNPDIYQKVIDYFGDLVTTDIIYGGVIDQMTSLRVCYNDPSMLRYIEQQLDSTIDVAISAIPPNGFINYARSDQLTIVGGNPQEADTSKRIRSFKQNPAPVLFSAVPIWTVFPEGPKRENMKRAYDNFVNNFSQRMGAEARNLQNLIAQEQFNPYQPHEVSVYFTQNYACNVGSMFGSWGDCSVVGSCRKACSVRFAGQTISNGQTVVLEQRVVGGTVRDGQGNIRYCLANACRAFLKVQRDEHGNIALFSELYDFVKGGNLRFLSTMAYSKPGVKSGCVDLPGSSYYVNDPKAAGSIIKACVRCTPTLNPGGPTVCDCPRL
ncbi:hypothetical protein ABK040_013065 [Willaertia magna]